MRINHGLRNGARIIANFSREFLQGAKGDQGIQGVAGATGQDGEGLMAGGQEGQILAKSSNADFDAEWVDAPVGGVLTEDSVTTEIVRDRAITAEKIAPNAIVVRGSAERRFSDEIAQAAQIGGAYGIDSKKVLTAGSLSIGF